jgi:hypothetical protein
VTTRRFVDGKEVAPAPEFAIDSSVPLPATGKQTGDTLKLRATLLKMEVGDSTVIPVHPVTGRATVRLANATRDIDGRKFTQRKVKEKSVLVVRVWRIK